MSNVLHNAATSYLGVRAPTPPNFISVDRDPTIYDRKPFRVGDFWGNYVTRDLFRLAGFDYNQAVNELHADWQLVSGGDGDVITLTSNTGGAVPADVNGNINVVGDGVGITGNGVAGTNTITFSLVGVTNHNVLVGGASNAITSVAPSVTSGVPFVSQGAGVDPAFGTAVVAGGGTGVTSLTAYAVLCGGTTSTNPVQSVAGLGAAGTVLTSNGAGALPTFQALPAGGVTSITGDTGGAQTGAITLTGGTTGAAFGGAAGTITMTFAGITANNGVVNLGTDNAANAINIGQGTTARTIGIGNSAAAHTVTLGSTNGAATTTIQSGSGGTILAGYTGIVTANNGSPITVSTVTQYGTVVAGTGNSVSSIAPSATSGIPYISQGSSANPAFGTAVVAGGGTGSTSFTAYAPVIAGTTPTGAFQSASTGLSTSGYVLTSNGSSAVPSFQALPGSKVAFFANATANQTITADATVVFDNVVLNTGSGYSSATNIFTAPNTGVYNIGYAVIVIGNLGDAVGIQKNGSGTLVYTNNVQVSGPAYYMTVPCNLILPLTAGDTIKVIYFRGSGINATINGQATYVTYFYGYQIS